METEIINIYLKEQNFSLVTEPSLIIQFFFLLNKKIDGFHASARV